MISEAELKTSIDQLNDLLRSELAAIETYRSAESSMPSTEDNRITLQGCLDGHRQRALRLRDLVLSLGGLPAYNPGACRAFAQTIEDAAELLGAQGAKAALQDSEIQRLSTYHSVLSALDPTTLFVVLRELLPAQRQVHVEICTLKDSEDDG